MSKHVPFLATLSHLCHVFAGPSRPLVTPWKGVGFLPFLVVLLVSARPQGQGQEQAAGLGAVRGAEASRATY